MYLNTTETNPTWPNSSYAQRTRIVCMLDSLGVPRNALHGFFPQMPADAVLDLFDSDEYAAVWNACVLPCRYELPAAFQPRLYLSIFGSVVASLTVICSVFIILLFLGSQKYRDSHWLYLTFLAVCDAVVAAMYLPLMTGKMLLLWLADEHLMSYWFRYTVPLLTLSHIAMTSASYLILAATFERYLVASRSPLLNVIKRARVVWCLCCVLMGIVSKGGIIFELHIARDVRKHYCVHFKVLATALAESPFYGSVYKFWLRNFTSVFIPFAVLLCLNVAIINILHRQRKTARLFRFAASDHKARIRSATKMLVCVTTTYLIANLLNVVITMWEHINKHSLDEYKYFYLYSVDLISLFTVIASLLRLPIYLMCCEEVRQDAQVRFACSSWALRFGLHGDALHHQYLPASQHDRNNDQALRLNQVGDKRSGSAETTTETTRHLLLCNGSTAQRSSSSSHPRHRQPPPTPCSDFDKMALMIALTANKSSDDEQRLSDSPPLLNIDICLPAELRHNLLACASVRTASDDTTRTQSTHIDDDGGGGQCLITRF